MQVVNDTIGQAKCLCSEEVKYNIGPVLLACFQFICESQTSIFHTDIAVVQVHGVNFRLY